MKVVRGLLPFLLGLVAGSGLTLAWALSDWSGDDAGAAIPLEIQRRTAVHEAGHAIVDAYLNDAQQVDSIMVRTRFKADGYYGQMTGPDEVGSQTYDMLLREVAGYLGGRAADKLLNGAPDDGSASDLEEATDIVWKTRLEYGMGRTLLVTDKESVSDETWDDVEADMQRANACAEAIIQSNRELVLLVSGVIMSRQPIADERRLSGDEFRVIIGENPILPPRLTVPFTADPCVF